MDEGVLLARIIAAHLQKSSTEELKPYKLALDLALQVVKYLREDRVRTKGWRISRKFHQGYEMLTLQVKPSQVERVLLSVLEGPGTQLRVKLSLTNPRKIEMLPNYDPSRIRVFAKDIAARILDALAPIPAPVQETPTPIAPTPVAPTPSPSALSEEEQEEVIEVRDALQDMELPMRNPFIRFNSYEDMVEIGFVTPRRTVWWIGSGGFKNLESPNVRSNPEMFKTRTDAERKIRSEILDFIRQWRKDQVHLIMGW